MHFSQLLSDSQTRVWVIAPYSIPGHSLLPQGPRESREHPCGTIPAPGHVPAGVPSVSPPAGVHGHLLRAGRPGDALPVLLLPGEERGQSV